MLALDTQLAHVWMVRALLKHSDEAEENEELCDVHRALYDYMLALGGPLKDGNAAEYLKLARKHTNFQMAVASLNAAVGEVGRLLEIGSEAAEVEEDWSE
jgi:hypothetical protein